jgi:predicted porin
MQKKLLVAAVGAALALGPVLSAQAMDMKIKGRVRAELVNVDGDTINNGDSRWEQGDANGDSRWGIFASEDLGNGLKAVARVDFQTSAIVGGDGDELNREHFVGIAGGFGQITFGRTQPAYKSINVGWDPYVAAFLQSRRAGGSSGDTFGHNGFRDDIIAYTTPKGSPIKVMAQVVMDEKNGQDGEYHVAAMWKGGPLELVAAANNDPQDNGDDLQNMKVAARFKSGGFTGMVQYEDVDQGGSIRANGNRIDVDPVTTGTQSLGEGSFLLVGLGYKFGANVVYGQVGGFDSDVDTISDVDYFAIGVTHFFSKKTRIYAGYSNIDVKDVGKTNMFGAGIRFDFG